MPQRQIPQSSSSRSKCSARALTFCPLRRPRETWVLWCKMGPPLSLPIRLSCSWGQCRGPGRDRWQFNDRGEPGLRKHPGERIRPKRRDSWFLGGGPGSTPEKVKVTEDTITGTGLFGNNGVMVSYFQAGKLDLSTGVGPAVFTVAGSLFYRSQVYLSDRNLRLFHAVSSPSLPDPKHRTRHSAGQPHR